MPVPISRNDQAYVQIKSLIATCELGPGQRVTERQLVELTGLGLASVRSAAAKLGHEGLLSVVARVGYRVRPITLKDAADLFDVWGLVGAAVVTLAVTNLTDEQLQQYVTQTRQWADEVAAGTITIELVAERSFGLVAQMASSERLLRILETLHLDIQRYWSIAAAVNGHPFPPEYAVLPMELRDLGVILEHFNAHVAATRQVIFEMLRSAPGIADASLLLAPDDKIVATV